MSKVIDTGHQKSTLIVKIENNQPIDLFDLNETLLSFAKMYKRYIAEDSETATQEYKLSVRNVRHGSMIFDLVPHAETLSLIPVMVKHAEELIGFGEKVVSLIDFFRGKGNKPHGLTVQDAHDISQLATVSANNNGTATCIQIEHVTFNTTVILDSTDANAMQNRARNFIASHQVPIKGLHEQVVMHWGTADRHATSSKDRAIIETFSKKPIKIIFANEEAKRAMMGEALFRKAYIVDVEIHTVNDEPKLYKVIKVTGTINLDE